MSYQRIEFPRSCPWRFGTLNRSGVTVPIQASFTSREGRMTRESVMSTPIFDELLREMAQRAEPRPPVAPHPEAEARAAADDPTRAGRRRHRAD
jgi:hypothetical protein